ncbi:MAG: endonuclease III [Oscillospiraceae bacterium]|jgi:endonuclease-3|nr:endonuclease III [Oscillospiraceae bacterium]
MENTAWVLDKLAEMYPEAKPELNFTNPYETLIAALLSAQATDRQVNVVTEKLFAAYPNARALAAADVADVEEMIRSIGLYHNKARNAVAACQILMTKHNGEVPQTIDELTRLPGVGRKVANVVLANAYGVPAFAVDTHVHRVSGRIGLASSKNPLQTERQLCEKIPPELWNETHLRLIYLGRRVCRAIKPSCAACPLAAECAYANNKQSL